VDKEEADLLLLLEKAVRIERNPSVVAALLREDLHFVSAEAVLKALDKHRANKNSQLRSSSR
jgi:hypothetical protein